MAALTSPGPHAETPRRRHLAEFAGTVHRILGEILHAHDRVALVDVPTHTNVGDSAIWLGELAALARLGIEVAYVCDLHSYDPKALRQRAGDAPILIHGGGNFGDLYPRHQAFRESVVRSFRDRLVVQLPQSVEFRDPGAARRAAAVMNEHPRLHLLLRDRRSLQRVRELVGSPVHLCPDPALCLEPLTRDGTPEVGVLALLREDEESLESGAGAPKPRQYAPRPSAVVADAVPGASVTGADRLGARAAATRVDWLAEPSSATLRAARRASAWMRSGGILARLGERRLPRLWERAARERVRRGIRLLSRGSVVLTDRLHGHILCLLAGIPHVVVPDRFGKIESFVSTWTGDVPDTHLAPHLEGGWASARRWAIRERRP
jgi:pyruvyl transferase EpsO